MIVFHCIVGANAKNATNVDLHSKACYDNNPPYTQRGNGHVYCKTQCLCLIVDAVVSF